MLQEPSPQQYELVRKGPKLMDSFAYQMQVLALQLRGGIHGGFASPILVSWRKLDKEDATLQFHVAVTFNLKAFGRRKADDIKKQIRQWVGMAWAKVMCVYTNTIAPLVKFITERPFICLQPGAPSYRDEIEILEVAFAGLNIDNPNIPPQLFHHREGFLPRKKAKQR